MKKLAELTPLAETATADDYVGFCPSSGRRCLTAKVGEKKKDPPDGFFDDDDDGEEEEDEIILPD